MVGSRIILLPQAIDPEAEVNVVAIERVQLHYFLDQGGPTLPIPHKGHQVPDPIKHEEGVWAQPQGPFSFREPRRQVIAKQMDVGHSGSAALWSPNVRYPSAVAYYTRYTERYGSIPSYHGAEAYSALLVAADALKRAKSFRPRDVRAALDQVYMQTPFGPVKFYTYEDFKGQNSVNTLVLQIIDGKFETVWPPEIASTQFNFPKVD